MRRAPQGTIRVDAGALSHPEAVDVELEAEGFNPRSVVASLALKRRRPSARRPASSSGDASTDSSGSAENVEGTQGGFLSRAFPAGYSNSCRATPRWKPW